MKIKTLNDYQKLAADTAIYPGNGTGSFLAKTYTVLGLSEAGEIQGKYKKIIRDKDGIVSKEDALEMVKELGDLQWYIANLATELGYSLEDVCNMNLDKLASRKERGVLRGSGDNR